MSTRPDLLSVVAAPPEWADAIRAAPRKHFIPATALATPVNGDPGHWIDRAAGPDAWQRAVDSDTTILTQVDDGDTDLTPESAPTGMPTSSSTAPSVVVDFLRLLDARPGHRVLEVGTGTGWTAALLSARLGASHVTSVEVDERVAAQAAANLRHAGFAPGLVVGDGAHGLPEGPLFDRVHVTCGIREIPYAWVCQTRPGGVIVLPWAPVRVGGFMVRLDVGDGCAQGRLLGDTAFMMLREQRFPYPPPRGERRFSTARVSPCEVRDAGRGVEVALAALVPGVLLNEFDATTGGLRDAEGNYAAVAEDGDGEYAVTQIGVRDLWTELENAFDTWVGWGRPEARRFGVAVDEQGQHVWLDTPDNRVTGGFGG
ncbi:methyltransferase domain-containing protein [Nocardiopsis ansamitocini]|uniref:Protein-L-isoaspartate O-methyltransferase n=1 Tax=Nocardiopsis ansamitocini TaxID=1670832 RepID=A0A9W6P5C2_9ACTN|nr:methyltransferase domain-containing protein [Nocardiopsis ansamitocini]GLU47361.1 protein-L-isoaspartate O-methyltransferase [Nocardiopsis ansamitocini]